MIGLLAARNGLHSSPRSLIQWLAVVAVAIDDSDAEPQCKDDPRGPTGAPAQVRRHVNLVMCWQGRFNGGGVQNRRPGARDIRIYRRRNRGCFPHFEARQIGKSALGLCVTTVGLGRFFAHARIL